MVSDNLTNSNVRFVSESPCSFRTQTPVRSEREPLFVPNGNPCSFRTGTPVRFEMPSYISIRPLSRISRVVFEAFMPFVEFQIART